MFAHCASSIIKCVAGIDMHGDRIRKIDKHNATIVCLIYFENENCNHFIICYKNKDNWEEWGKDL